MNLPTKLTVFRIFLAPVFFILITVDYFQKSPIVLSIVLALLFFISEITDVLDGYIARKRNLVTDLGKVLDPFSDVLSRITFFISFSVVGIMPFYFFLIIMYREFCQTFLRMLNMKSGVAVPANNWGKIKAVFYSFSSALGLLFFVFKINGTFESSWEIFYWVCYGSFAFAALSSVVSFMTYAVPFFKKYKIS
ncbi:MAG: CDP-diacylglycerol--glycerol-3-phosphate 3-phosphatidyltransferase [Spirochaetales bacterium]|nr:CDP-diacylglycerol--glycerol-3-phosphate 3-phosphatidyltransferase [Spirochaetales bacterium]